MHLGLRLLCLESLGMNAKKRIKKKVEVVEELRRNGWREEYG